MFPYWQPRFWIQDRDRPQSETACADTGSARVSWCASTAPLELYVALAHQPPCTSCTAHQNFQNAFSLAVNTWVSVTGTGFRLVSRQCFHDDCANRSLNPAYSHKAKPIGNHQRCKALAPPSSRPGQSSKNRLAIQGHTRERLWGITWWGRPPCLVGRL